MGRRRPGRAGPLGADHDAPRGGLGRAGPAALVDHARHRLRRGPGPGAAGVRRGRRRRVLGRPADLRPGRPRRATRSARASCGPTTAPRPRRAALAERMGGDDINRARTGIPLDAGAVAAKLAWLADHEPGRLEAADLDPVAARPGRLPHDGPGGHRRHVRVAQRAVRLRRQRGAGAGRPGAGQAPERRALRHRGRPAEVGAGRRAGAAAGHPRGHRRRRPPVRGAGVGRVGGPPDGQLGHHRQRVGARARAPRSPRRPARW